jgi:hypothetical protein
MLNINLKFILYDVVLPTMKIDTSKNGLGKYFKDHEIVILSILWEKPGSIFTSRDVWIEVNHRLKGEAVSRGTVINFLESMFGIGLVEKTRESCRGGQRGLYVLQMTEGEVRKFLLTRIFKDVLKDYFGFFGTFPEMNLGEDE